MENEQPRLILEACVETLEQALLAQERGAHRIELCADLSVGGLTPPMDLVERVMEKLTIPVMVMVRPRGGNFVFSENEMAEMSRSIERFRRLGVTGVVVGNLTEKNEVDLEQTKRLVQLAQPMEVTFHKAIDLTPDLVGAVRKIAQIPGIQRILTSGGAQTALLGATVLQKMLAAAGEDLTILVAGKVTQENLAVVHEKIGAREYHGRRIVF